MTILKKTGKLIAYGLLLASLALPSAVSAEEQTKYSKELAPGFDICAKSAADTAKNSAEYRVALSVCLNLAEKYWEGIVKKENQNHIDMHEDVSYYEYVLQAVTDLQKAWLQYKEAGSDLIRSDGDPMATIRARYFDVQETRRQAEVMANFFSEDTHETYDPGFDMCVKNAAETNARQSDYMSAHGDCLDTAHQYLEAILNKKYEIYMNLYKDAPEKQKKLEKFQKTWKQYVDAGKYFHNVAGGRIGGITAQYFENDETSRQAKMLECSGTRW